MTAKQITNRRAKVLATLKTRNYCGWSGDTEILSYPWSRFKDWCTGAVLEGIGSGNFRDALHNVLAWSVAWHDCQLDKRKLESKYGLDKLTNS